MWKFCNQNFQIAFFQEYWLLVQQKIGNLHFQFLNQMLNYGNKLHIIKCFEQAILLLKVLKIFQYSTYLRFSSTLVTSPPS